MNTITKKSDLRAGNIICLITTPSESHVLTKLTNFDLDNLKLENNPNAYREPLTVSNLRALGFNPVHRGRKMSIHGKNFAFVIEHRHMRGSYFEFWLTAPVVKHVQFVDQIQNIFHALEDYELNFDLLLT